MNTTITTSRKITIPVCTVLAETSPQALPLGAACIASAINATFSKESLPNSYVEAQLVVFSREDKPSAEKIANILLRNSPAAICFSVFVWNQPLLAQAARLIHKSAPNIPLLAGGPEITAGTTTGDFDYLVTGEGESVVPSLLRELLAEEEHSSPPHIIHGHRLSPEDLVSPYLDGTLNPRFFGGALWELARGCPFKCAYCYESKGEKTVAYFPLERIKSELQLFARTGVQQVFVLDPTYNAQKKRALQILRLIKKEASGIFFHFECRAEFLDMELAQAFASIPCSLQIGLQSANENVLKLVNRSFNRKEFTRKIDLLNKSGAVFGFDLIYGLPGDTFDGFKESIDFAINLYPNSLELFRLSVLPGTTLHDQHKALGLNAQNEPPYLVLSTPEFPPEMLAKAEQLATATGLFYSSGRAVGWFHSVLRPLRCKPSEFFSRFAIYLAKQHANLLDTPDGCQLPHARIEKLQIEFVKQEFTASGLQNLIPAALDCIRLNGAMSRAYADGETSRIQLSYHPDDILSQYSQDLVFFCKNARKRKITVRVEPSAKGPVWRHESHVS